MSRPSTLVLVNRAAGRRRAAQIYTSVARYFSDAKCAADFAVPQSADEFCALAIDAARGKYRNVVALGGDGTFHQLANACLNFEVNLGLIPAGSGNDIAAAFGIPRDPIEAAHAFIHGAAQPVDVVRVRSCPVEQTAADSKDQAGEEVFIGAGGLGLDAEAAELANTRFRGWTGASRYILGAISARRRATNLEISAEIDELHWEGRVILAAVANGTRYGSGIQIAPQARMNDGYLDVALVGDVSLSRLYLS